MQTITEKWRDLYAEIERLRAEVHQWIMCNEIHVAEIEQLKADKAALSQIASDYLHDWEDSRAEIERLRAQLTDQQRDMV